MQDRTGIRLISEHNTFVNSKTTVLCSVVVDKNSSVGYIDRYSALAFSLSLINFYESYVLWSHFGESLERGRDDRVSKVQLWPL